MIRWLRRKLAKPPRTMVWERYPDPDKDGEGHWIWSKGRQPWESGAWLWMPDALHPKEKCPSELCLFGREWIPCKKRRGHRGRHRNCETWAWEEGDERA